MRWLAVPGFERPMDVAEAVAVLSPRFGRP
jgi:hypothetical protein